MTIRALISRVSTILQRYSLSSRKFANAVIPMTELCLNSDVHPTFPSTATAVQRQPGLFRQIQTSGADLAIHGYRHLDYTLLDVSVVRAHYQEAINIFKENCIKFTGYRFPYLRRDNERIDLLADYNVQWDSSEVIAWPLINKENLTEIQWEAFQKILTTYEPKWIDETVSLPYFRENILEIPVSIPDDDILIERIKLSTEAISDIWQQMVKQTSQLNEMVILQLHPERYHCFSRPLQDVLGWLNSDHTVWKASLSEIARWWKIKSHTKVEIQNHSKNVWLIQAKLKDKVSLLVRNLQVIDNSRIGPYSGFLTQQKEIFIQSETKPVIGIHSKCDNWIKKHLTNDGFLVEVSDTESQYACFVGKNSIKTTRQLIKYVNKCQKPLIQIWRWPDEKRYCFCVSGDIDGTTLIDFWDRIYGRI